MGVFAVVCLFIAVPLDIVPGSAPIDIFGETLVLPIYIPGIDWGVIAIILGSSLFVDVTSKSGLFTWIAIKLTKTSGGDPRRLLWFYGVMTVVFSAVLNNVTAMIIVGSKPLSKIRIPSSTDSSRSCCAESTVLSIVILLNADLGAAL